MTRPKPGARRGRPATVGATARVTVRYGDDHAAELDALKREHGMEDVAAVIRLLIERSAEERAARGR